MTGECQCGPGFIGEMCDIQCPYSRYHFDRHKITSISFSKKFAIFQHVTKTGCCLLQAASKESDELIN